MKTRNATALQFSEGKYEKVYDSVIHYPYGGRLGCIILQQQHQQPTPTATITHIYFNADGGYEMWISDEKWRQAPEGF